MFIKVCLPGVCPAATVYHSFGVPDPPDSSLYGVLSTSQPTNLIMSSLMRFQAPNEPPLNLPSSTPYLPTTLDS